MSHRDSQPKPKSTRTSTEEGSSPRSGSFGGLVQWLPTSLRSNRAKERTAEVNEEELESERSLVVLRKTIAMMLTKRLRMMKMKGWGMTKTRMMKMWLMMKMDKERRKNMTKRKNMVVRRLKM